MIGRQNWLQNILEDVGLGQYSTLCLQGRFVNLANRRSILNVDSILRPKSWPRTVKIASDLLEENLVKDLAKQEQFDEEADVQAVCTNAS